MINFINNNIYCDKCISAVRFTKVSKFSVITFFSWILFSVQYISLIKFLFSISVNTKHFRITIVQVFILSNYIVASVVSVVNACNFFTHTLTIQFYNIYSIKKNFRPF